MPTRKIRKYIFISGGVISGIGKGITSASISLLLKSSGLNVAPIKFENYLNMDAGTINPIEHGDVFLCEDGTEGDMDIGTYEKFLNEDMGKDNFVTMGRIYSTVIEKERKFEYKGEDVEAIPHITDEIIKRIENVGEKKDAEVVIIELGGTVGEYQNVLYYEASRILGFKNPGDVIHIHVSYVPTPAHLGEPKTKPTQLSVRQLNELGIQPDFIIARSKNFLDERRRYRIALFCNVNPENVISSPDLESVYEVPLILEKQGLAEKIIKKLGLKAKKTNLYEWKKYIDKVKKAKKGKEVEIAIVGKYFGTGDYQIKDSYAALFDALEHASTNLNIKVTTKWIDAEKLEKTKSVKGAIGEVDGIIVPIGWGERGVEGMIKAASFARINKIPYLGLCYGMQIAAISFARDVLGLKDANTQENKKTKNPIICYIPSQIEILKKREYGGTMRLGGWDAIVRKGSLAWHIYDIHNGFKDKSKSLTSERHRHRYEFNSKYAREFENKGMILSTKAAKENLVEIIELPQSAHPFYLGTQGHPEYKSRPLKPHPIFLEFIKVCSS